MADRLATVLTGYTPAARTAARTALASVIQRAYTVGDNPLVTARQISRQFAGITYTRAATIARTEMGVAGWSRTQQQYANDPAVRSWQWMATFDGKTCNICTSMHGREFPTSRRLETHPNCRCTMLPVTRNNRPIPANETGVARIRGMNDQALRAMWGPTRARLISGGADPLSLIGSRVHPVFGRQPVLKSLKQMGVSPTRATAQRAGLQKSRGTARARLTPEEREQEVWPNDNAWEHLDGDRDLGIYGHKRGAAERAVQMRELDDKGVYQVSSGIRQRPAELYAIEGDMENARTKWAIEWQRGSTNPPSAMMQQILSEERGVSGAIWHKGRPLLEPSDAMRDLTADIYETTQRTLTQDSYTLYRGVTSPDWSGNVMESWTTDINVARQFDGHAVYEAIVPRKRIFADLEYLAPGNPEKEFIVMGGGSNLKLRLVGSAP